jgi:drug/metabolite transporter (DMT)-like permease
VLATLGYGVGASALWGAGDFSGGVATKRRNAFAVVCGAHSTGLLLAVVLALLLREPLASGYAVMWGAIAGVAGGLALAAFYRSLAIGVMGINAPVAALITAGLPVILAIHQQGYPKPLQLAGFGLAACSIVLVSRPQKLHGRPKGLGLAILSGFGFGVFLVGMQRAGSAHVWWPMAVARAASAGIAGIGFLFARQASNESRSSGGIRLVLAAGICDTLGNAMFMLAARSGRLDVAAALSSLYPVTTVLLARVIFGEHVHRVQAIGSALALIAVPMIAA